MKQKESEIQKAILDYLSISKVFAWRNQTGATKIGSRFIRFGHKGSSDILGILPSGRFLAVEVKTSDGKLSQYQEDFLDKIQKNHGLAIVARSLEDVMSELSLVL